MFETAHPAVGGHHREVAESGLQGRVVSGRRQSQKHLDDGEDIDFE